MKTKLCLTDLNATNRTSKVISDFSNGRVKLINNKTGQMITSTSEI